MIRTISPLDRSTAIRLQAPNQNKVEQVYGQAGGLSP
jgi:hypothetical protein